MRDRAFARLERAPGQDNVDLVGAGFDGGFVSAETAAALVPPAGKLITVAMATPLLERRCFASGMKRG